MIILVICSLVPVLELEIPRFLFSARVLALRARGGRAVETGASLNHGNRSDGVVWKRRKSTRLAFMDAPRQWSGPRAKERSLSKTRVFTLPQTPVRGRVFRHHHLSFQPCYESIKGFL